MKLSGNNFNKKPETPVTKTTIKPLNTVSNFNSATYKETKKKTGSENLRKSIPKSIIKLIF